MKEQLLNFALSFTKKESLNLKYAVTILRMVIVLRMVYGNEIISKITKITQVDIIVLTQFL